MKLNLLLQSQLSIPDDGFVTMQNGIIVIGFLFIMLLLVIILRQRAKLNAIKSELMVATKEKNDLKDKQQQLRLAITSGGYYLWEYDLIKDTVNSNHPHSIAYNGIAWNDIIPQLLPKHQHALTQWMQNIVQGKANSRELIFCMLTKTGSQNWVQINGIACQYDQNGTVTRIVGLERDYNIEVKAKNKLQVLSLKLEFAIKSLGASTWEYDIEANLLISEYPKSVLIHGLTFEAYLEVHHPDDRELLNQEFQKLRNNQIERLKLEVRQHLPGDKYIWIEIHGVVYKRDASGKAKKIIGLRRDIDDEVKARREFQKNKQQLEEYSIQSELAMNSAGIVLWNYDVTKERFFSPNADSFMHQGISKKDFLSLIAPDHSDLIKNGIDQFVHNKCDHKSYQFKITMPDNQVKWVEITAVVFKRDAQGNVIKIVGLRKDITSQLAMTNELIELRDKAEEANKLKSAFLANMSHEIRTPLNAIVGFSNLIADTEDKVEIEEYVKVIETNNELLLQLINDILDLSKIEAGKLVFSISEINVTELLGQLEQMFMMRVKEGVEIIFDLPEKDYYIKSERNRITQVLTNFLSNAIKFTFHGSIHLGCKRNGNTLYFYVKDTGKGILAENVPYVFDRFSKFDNFVQGTGLGLSICKTIIEKLEGQIGVESEIDKGSNFWFSIPCDIYAEATPKPEEDHNEEDHNIYHTSQKILIAEDNKSNYQLLEKILKGYELLHAWDGQEAIEIYQQQNPALILMDIRMPKKDGYQATAEIRKLSRKIPIIAVTASVFGEEEKRIMSSGFTAFIAKPVHTKKLKELITKYLSN